MKMKMKIFIGADHAGFRLKEHLKKFLAGKGHSVTDFGNTKYDPEDDYPDFAFKVAGEVSKAKSLAKGILCCGSAEGMAIAANKVSGIRAVPVWTIRNARLSREHNDANVLCLSGWQLSVKKAEAIAVVWLGTAFSGLERHKRRIRKIRAIEKKWLK